MTRADRLAAAIERLLDSSDPLHRRWVDDGRHFEPETLLEGVRQSLGSWDRAGIAALLRRDPCPPDRALPPRTALVVLGGVLPPSHVQAIAAPWLLGSDVRVKAPSADPVFPAVFAEALGERVRFVSREQVAEQASRADAVVVVGDDEAVRTIRALTPIATPFVGYGHRAAVGVAEADADEASATRFARDVATFDQRGCLSLQELLVVGDLARARRFGEGLAAHLGGLARRRSLGLDAEAALRSTTDRAIARGEIVFGPTDLQWGVRVTDGPRWEGTHGGRHVIVRAVSDPVGALEPLAHHLSAVSTAGTIAPGHVAAWIRLGASRIVAAGTLQCTPPSWAHDGRRPLSSLCRWFDRE